MLIVSEVLHLYLGTHATIKRYWERKHCDPLFGKHSFRLISPTPLTCQSSIIISIIRTAFINATFSKCLLSVYCQQMAICGREAGIINRASPAGSPSLPWQSGMLTATILGMRGMYETNLFWIAPCCWNKQSPFRVRPN